MGDPRVVFVYVVCVLCVLLAHNRFARVCVVINGGCTFNFFIINWISC